MNDVIAGFKRAWNSFLGRATRLALESKALLRDQATEIQTVINAGLIHEHPLLKLPLPGEMSDWLATHSKELKHLHQPMRSAGRRTATGSTESP